MVDRPGVPKDMRDAFWWTYEVNVGLIGTTAQIALPAGERILAASEGLVVSARESWDEEAVIRVWEFGTGVLIRKIRSSVSGPDAVLAGRRLFWGGTTPGTVSDDEAADGGVWTADVDGEGEPVAIVTPGKLVGARLGSRVLRLSPSGRTLAAVMSAGELSWTDFIDVASATLLGRVRDVSVWALTDDTFVSWDIPWSDAPYYGNGITAYDVTSGTVRWHFPAASDVDRFVPRTIGAVGSLMVVQYTWRTGSATEDIVAIFDAGTGERQVLLRRTTDGDPWPTQVDTQVSSAAHLALAESYLVGYSFHDGKVPVSIIDVAAKELTLDAFVVDPPWLCGNRTCRSY